MHTANPIWHKIDSPEQQTAAPTHNTRLVVFGASFNSDSIQTFTDLFVAQNIPVSAFARFKPHDLLNEAVSFVLDVPVSEIDAQYKARIRNLFALHNLEAAILVDAPTLAKPGLLVMDMDSTAIQIECIDEIARLAGVYDEVASVTKAAMAGHLAFSDSLRQRVAKLKGIELSLLDTIRFDLPLMPGVDLLCGVLKAKGWTLAIASGGFTLFAEQLRTPLQLDEIVANELTFEGSQLAGSVTGRIIDAEAKRETLLALKAQYGIADTQTVAIGDGANDLLMMDVAQLGVAIHGKEKVVQLADAAICHGSLLQLIYFLTTP